MGLPSRMFVVAGTPTSRAAVGMRLALMILFGGFFWAFLAFDRPALAAAGPPVRTLSATADTSIRTRREAIKSIPLDRLEASDREKVAAVLSNVTVFRRMPTKVIDCDPKMYLFLVRHPDVVVSIWELLKISKLQMSETGDGAFALSEPDGASVSLRFVHQSHDTHVIYGEGTYRGPLLPRPVTGRGVLVLKTGYVRETNGRYYITNRLDCFLSVEPIGAELLTKTVSPLVGKTADNNFTQSAAFLSTISRTAEVSSRTIRALALRLDRVQPEVKAKLVVLAEAVNRKSVAARAENEKVKR